MLEITLNGRETALLKQWLRRGEADEEFHQLLEALDTLLNDKSGVMKLPEPILSRIRARASDRKFPAHQALLSAIFLRSLGSKLKEA
jgi:hypothetical protein